MSDPTGSNSTSEPEPRSVEGLQPEDFRPRRRSLYAVPLWTRSLPEAAPPAPGPARRPILVLAGAAAVAAWVALVFWAADRQPGPPARPPLSPRPTLSWTATPGERGVAAAEGQARPVYRRLTKEDLLSQVPPGAVLVE
jgi:hypothetical protein